MKVVYINEYPVRMIDTGEKLYYACRDLSKAMGYKKHGAVADLVRRHIENPDILYVDIKVTKRQYGKIINTTPAVSFLSEDDFIDVLKYARPEKAQEFNEFVCNYGFPSRYDS
ncbi:MAG: Bro-N domain-containing protein [Ruminococcus flavefaciens]|nr:Bro-N domain-containing protein [Ruminococcus flavefaciens]MCM1229240.1 Bro-N domain-containing protein [Ruminococcus flavefaciens]